MSPHSCLSDGCEFIDDGCYGDIPPAIEVGRLYHLRTALLRMYVDQRQIEAAWSDDRSWLRENVAERGILTPLELHVDQLGRARLREGHHRLCVAEELGIPVAPTKVKLLPHTWERGASGVFLPAPTVFLLEQWLDLLTRKDV